MTWRPELQRCSRLRRLAASPSSPSTGSTRSLCSTLTLGMTPYLSLIRSTAPSSTRRQSHRHALMPHRQPQCQQPHDCEVTLLGPLHCRSGELDSRKGPHQLSCIAQPQLFQCISQALTAGMQLSGHRLMRMCWTHKQGSGQVLACRSLARSWCARTWTLPAGSPGKPAT